MREILFRGKYLGRLHKKGFVFGSLGVIGTDLVAIYQCKEFTEDVKFLVDLGTVGQYTNKKDINGTKIFEYDIVKEGCNGLIGVVVWDDDLATYKLDGFGEGYTIQDAEIEWEIIGNKFDNPELLRTPQNDEVRE